MIKAGDTITYPLEGKDYKWLVTNTSRQGKALIKLINQPFEKALFIEINDDKIK